jgi:hypothetical protein
MDETEVLRCPAVIAYYTVKPGIWATSLGGEAWSLHREPG